MAVDVIILKSSRGGYYTADGLADYNVLHSSSTPATGTEVSARKYTITAKLMDPNAGTLYYSHTGYEGISSASRGSKRYYTNDGATSVLSYDVYYLINDNGSLGSPIMVYGAHPAAPGLCDWYTSTSGGAVNFRPSSAALYAITGGLTHIEGDLTNRAPGLESGTTYDTSKIVYSNASNQFRFGATIARDKSYAIFAGYRWFMAISPLGVTLASTVNTATRTVANGIKRALVTNLDGYNAGTASATVKESTGSLTFAYRAILRQNMGDYEQGSSSRTVQPITATEADTGISLVLRSLETSNDGSGVGYAVGAEIADILTRRPSLAAYDTRVTLYGRFAHRVDIALDNDGGSSLVTAVYRSVEDAQFFADTQMLSAILSVSVPTKANAVFEGYYTVGGALAIAADGRFSSDYAPTAPETVHARWRTVVDVGLDKAEGTGGTSLMAYDSSIGGFTADGGTQSVMAITPPRRPQWRFDGYFTTATGGTQCVAADGALTDYLIALGAASPTTLFAHWTRISYKATFNRWDGEGGPDAIYCDGENAVFYLAPDLTEQTDSIELPTLAGHTFTGYFVNGTPFSDADGLIIAEPFAQDITASAGWRVNDYLLFFDYGKGSGSTESKQVTFGEAVGQLPVPTPPAGETFEGWFVNGVAITAEFVFNFQGDALAVARWRGSFSTVEDFFGLASASLVPVASSTGDTHESTAVAHYGKYTQGVNVASAGVWRNPTVTYAVVKDMTLSVLLGRAFKAVKSGGVMTVSGYMITAVEVATQIGQFPTVTVTGTANEGENAINSFAVRIPVVGRSKAQNILDAVTGGGYIQRCVLRAVCDPVVLAENMMPCASDVVNGRYEVSAETLATAIHAAPRAGGGFTLLGVPKATRDMAYVRYSFEAKREM